MRLAAFAVTAALIAAPALAQEVPTLTGTWKAASGDGIAQTQGRVTGPATIVIGEQTGRSFKAELVYPGESGEVREPLLGTIAPDGRAVYLVGNDGYHLATLQSPTVLDHCYLEADADDAMAVCERLEKQ